MHQAISYYQYATHTHTQAHSHEFQGGGSQSYIQAPFVGSTQPRPPAPTIPPKLEQWVWITPRGNYEVRSFSEAKAFINAELKC